jgi:hypothetical protein
MLFYVGVCPKCNYVAHEMDSLPCNFLFDDSDRLLEDHNNITGTKELF